MEIKLGEGKTEFGPGVSIDLTGDEVALAIDAYLVSHGVHVDGARTIRVNGGLCEKGSIYVDPSGFVISPTGDKLPGRGDGGFTLGADVKLYDRYRFAIPVDATIVKFSDSNDGVECVLRSSNNPNYSVGSKVWVSINQLRRA